MRDWLWRALVYAGVGLSGCAPWACVTSNPDQSFFDALFGSPPAVPSTRTGSPTRRGRGRRKGEIAQECEAFVSGRYHEIGLRCHRKAPPGWVWVNALAHAERAELQRLAALSSTRDDRLGFLSYLADEVLLSAGPDDVTLLRIQRDTLMPFELALLHHQPRSADLTKLARVIRDQLEHPFHDGEAPATLASKVLS